MEIETAVARAIRQELASALGASCQVYDHPPANAAMPFVTFDRHICQPQDDLGEQMSRHQVTLTVWSKTRGPKEIRTILGKLRRALHWTDLVLEEGACVVCEVDRTDATRDADGVTYMGTALVSVLTDNRHGVA